MSISIVLPSDTEANGSSGPIPSVEQINAGPQREIAFFDETVTGYVIYQDTEKPAIKRSTVFLNVSIVPEEIKDISQLETFPREASTENGVAGSNFNIVDMTLGSEDIVYNGIDKDKYYIVWRFEVAVTYPRRKSVNPRILLACYLHDNDEDFEADKESTPSPRETSPGQSQEILPNFQPKPIHNMFAELSNSISVNELSNRQYELPSSMVEVEKVSKRSSTGPPPTQPSTPQINHITQEIERKETLKTSISIPVSVSLVIKLKSTKPAGRNNILLATLNIESSDELIKLSENAPYTYYFKILGLTMDFKYGVIKEFKTNEYKYPLLFRLGDAVNLTYKLLNNEFLDKELKNIDNTPNSSSANNLQFSKSVNIKLVLQVQSYNEISGEYSNISNTITTNWSPYLDFSIIAPPINNSLKTSSNYSQMQSQPVLMDMYNSQAALNRAKNVAPSTRKSALINNLYRLKSPPAANQTKISNSTGTLVSGPTPKLPPASLASASSVTVNLATNNNSSLSGLKLTFIGKLDIKLGEIINWKVQAINNSVNRLNLSLIVQNPINFNPIYSSSSAPGNISSSNLLNSNQGGNRHDDDIIIYNKSQLYSSYNALKLTTNGIIILNNDIRIGPIDSGTVFETDLRLIGISKGIFNLDGIKIFDINSGDGLDFGKLVEVFVV